MTGATINIDGAKYAVVFNYKTFKALGRLWGLPGIQDVIGKIASLENTENLTFEQFDSFGELVIAGIEAGGESFHGDVDDAVNAVMFDPATRESFMQELAASFAPVDDKKKQTPKVNPASRKKK